MIQEYNFIFKFKLDDSKELESYLDELCEAGCDDSLVGCGRTGYLAMDFTREAVSMKEAIETAMHDVRIVIGDVALIEIEMKEDEAKELWDRDLADIEAGFLPEGKTITDMPIMYSIDGIPVDNIINNKDKV